MYIIVRQGWEPAVTEAAVEASSYNSIGHCYSKECERVTPFYRTNAQTRKLMFSLLLKM